MGQLKTMGQLKIDTPAKPKICTLPGGTKTLEALMSASSRRLFDPVRLLDAPQVGCVAASASNLSVSLPCDWARPAFLGQ